MTTTKKWTDSPDSSVKLESQFYEVSYVMFLNINIKRRIN